MMAVVGPTLRSEPGAVAGALALAFAASFGLQVLVAAGLRPTPLAPARAAYAICAGNRNVALFLVALPAAVTDPLLLFIGCYQIPMYLTPVLMARLYRAAA
jgi:arsenite transporter